MAQVVGAGYSVSDETGDISTLVKLFRVGMLAPVVFVGALFLRQSGQSGEKVPLVPGFVIGFLALAGLNSLGWLPNWAVHSADNISRACLVTAVAAVGMKTSFEDLKSVGRSAPIMILVLTIAIAAYVLIGQQLIGG